VKAEASGGEDDLYTQGRSAEKSQDHYWLPIFATPERKTPLRQSGPSGASHRMVPESFRAWQRGLQSLVTCPCRRCNPFSVLANTLWSKEKIRVVGKCWTCC